MAGFCVALPDLSDEQFARLSKWASDTSLMSDFVMKGGLMQMICLRDDHKSVREFQRLIRTNLLNWGATLPPKQMGWVKQINNVEYDALRKGLNCQKRTNIDSVNVTGLKLPVNLLTPVH